MTTGIGIRSTRYSGVRPDGSRSDNEGTGVVMTHLEWEVTPSVDLDLDYQVQVGFARGDDVNHNLRALLSVDLIDDFDLDVGFQWDRVGDPVPLADGTLPDGDDFRVTVGVSWDF